MDFDGFPLPIPIDPKSPFGIGQPFNLDTVEHFKIAEHYYRVDPDPPSVRDGAPAGIEILQSSDFKEAFRLAAKKVNAGADPAKGGLKLSQKGRKNTSHSLWSIRTTVDYYEDGFCFLRRSVSRGWRRMRWSSFVIRPRSISVMEHTSARW